MRDAFKTPNGDIVTSKRAYIKSWRDMADKLEEALSVEVSSFDPMFDFHDKGNWNAGVQIPLWLAKRIIGLAERKVVE